MKVSCCFSTIAGCALAVLLSLDQIGSAGAQTVLLDFGNDASFRGLSVHNPDDLGHYWNSLRTGVFYQDLIDIDNNATTMDFGFSTPVATDSYNGPAGATDAATLQSDAFFTDIDAAALGNLGGALEAAFDYVAGPDLPDNRVRFEIQQLDPAKRYNLSFFGSHKFSTDSTTIYSVYTDNTYSTLVGTASLDVQEPVAPFNEHNRDRVATISDLSPQTANILYVEFVGSDGNLGYLNAMQIETAAPVVVAGDYNADSLVDAADYVLWRDDPAAHGGDPAGYDTWRANFGAPLAAFGMLRGGMQSAIPEPASLALATIGLAAAASFSRLRRW